MKFLVDAHLPPGLCRVLQEAGHDTLHTSGLPAGNDTSDEEINRVSVAGHWVVISKDTDFYYSHLLHGKPWKLLLVRTGNISTADLRALLRSHLSAIESAFASCTLVEIDRMSVTGHG